MKKNLRLVVFGMMGSAPFAGVAWQVLHYLEGFRRLGHDVFYIEDTGAWPYDPEQNTITDDCRYTVDYISRLMKWCGLGDRWAYRLMTGEPRVFGLSESQLSCLLQKADALVNLTGATLLREEHLKIPVRIYLETDPVLPQIEVAQGRSFTINLLAAHTHYFTYGENIGQPGCDVPVGMFEYHPTRQPIVLDWWSPSNARRNADIRASDSRAFSTIANWKQSGKDIEWNGSVYLWSKHHEFLKFIDLPGRARRPLELALACDDAEMIRTLASHGWHVVDAITLSRNILSYRDYILGSAGEFTVAKDQNIRLRSGWFSDRSACYLAGGKPVVTQDTGFGRVLPTSAGLFAFRTMDEIIGAFEIIDSHYERQSRAARDIAEQYFKAETVLAKIVEEVGL